MVPISRILADEDLTQEQRRVLELAFSAALHKLRLVHRNDLICEIVARKVIDIGKSGPSDDAVAIAEIAYRQLAPEAPPLEK